MKKKTEVPGGAPFFLPVEQKVVIDLFGGSPLDGVPSRETTRKPLPSSGLETNPFCLFEGTHFLGEGNQKEALVSGGEKRRANHFCNSLPEVDGAQKRQPSIFVCHSNGPHPKNVTKGVLGCFLLPC